VTNARDQGVPESVLKDWLGHLSMTSIYLATATSSELAAIAGRVSFSVARPAQPSRTSTGTV
jgi:hypothetical protein